MIAPGPISTPSGQELLAEFVQYGRQRPFEEITRRYAGMVFNVCLRVTKDKHDAEDATQAVFLTLALKAKQGTEIKALGPWLQQVAKRLSLDMRRGKKRRKTREERHEVEQTVRRDSHAADVLPSADLDELKVILHEELQKLPAKYRIPLILHYFGGMNREEMAAELNVKPSTLGVRIFRGREMLAGRLSGRGMTMASGAIAFALAYVVRETVSDGMVAGTGHAAAMMAAGHSGAGLASANVIALTQRAGGALAVGKLKVGAAVFLLTGASLGAGGRAIGVIPPIDAAAIVQRVVEAGVRQLIRPLVAPIANPLRVDATPKPTAVPAASVPVPSRLVATSAAVPVMTRPAAPVAANEPVAVAVPHATTPVALAPLPTLAPGPVASESSPTPLSTAAGTPRTAVATAVPVTPPTPVARRSTTPTDPAGDFRAGGSPPATPSAPNLAAAAAATPADNGLYVPAADAADSATYAAGGGGIAAATTPAGTARGPTHTFATAASAGSSVGSSVGSSADMVVSPASQVQIIQVPAAGGSLTECNGVLRGSGTVALTGTIDVNGKVVADGDGHDRTLSLAGLTGVRTSAPVGNAGGAGWYAADHGRLTLPLRAAANDPASLAWGTDPDVDRLSLVNSVRVTIDDGMADPSDAAAAGMTAEPMAMLSLIAPNRDDAPDLQQIDGAPIGIWQIDDTAGDAAGNLVDALVSVRYDDNLIDLLGGSESAVQLWTLDACGGNWEPVPAGAYTLDTVDHIVTGQASDFIYFAVSVPPAAGRDVGYILAHPAAEAAAVPEPATLALLAAAALPLLGRRRRA